VKKAHKLIFIFLVLLAQGIWLGWPRFTRGEVIEESYRRTERLEAHRESFIHPSEDSKAAADAEDARLYDYLGKRNAAMLVLLLIVNGIGIYYVWNYEARKTEA
jgi:hypothetical protein